MKFLPLFILTFLAGAGMSVQAGVNTTLKLNWAQNSLLTAFTSFLVGTLGLLVCLLAMRVSVPALPEKFTWWHWTGGLLGAYMVLMAIVSAPRLGATTMFALIIAGQLIASVIFDHFGLLGFAQQSISWQRIAGILLIAGGALLVRKF